MTELLSRPIRRVSPAEKGPERPLALSALIAAGWSAGFGLAVCIVTAVAAWFAGGTGSFGGAVRVGVLAWVVGNGGGLHLDGVTVSMVPLGFVAFAGWLLYRGGRWSGAHSAVRSLADVAAGVAAMACTYAGTAVVAQLATRSDTAEADPLRAALVPFGVAVLAGGIGILRGSGHGALLWSRLHDEVRAAVVGGAAAVGAMVAAGALLVAGSLVVHFSSALRLAEGMQAGLVGGIVILLLGVVLAPNAVLFAGSFIAGPGFAVGVGTSVAPDDVRLGSLPAFPLLAALPRDGATAGWQTVLVALPVVAGLLAGVVAVRRYPVFGLDHAALRGALAGLAGALAYGLLTWLSAGSVGPGRMAEVGPDVWGTLLVCVVAFVLGGSVGGMATRVLERRRRARRTENSATAPERDADEATVPIEAVADSDEGTARPS